MTVSSLYPALLASFNSDQLETIANEARAIIFGDADQSAKSHAGLILHYAREYQK